MLWFLNLEVQNIFRFTRPPFDDPARHVTLVPHVDQDDLGRCRVLSLALLPCCGCYYYRVVAAIALVR